MQDRGGWDGILDLVEAGGEMGSAHWRLVNGA